MKESEIRKRLAEAKPDETPLCCLYLVASVFADPSPASGIDISPFAGNPFANPASMWTQRGRGPGWMGDVSGNPFDPIEGPDDPDANTPAPEPAEAGK